MVLHLPYAEGGFGVSFNCVTKDVAFYTTTSRFVSWIGDFSQERQELWLPSERSGMGIRRGVEWGVAAFKVHNDRS